MPEMSQMQSKIDANTKLERGSMRKIKLSRLRKNGMLEQGSSSAMCYFRTGSKLSGSFELNLSPSFDVEPSMKIFAQKLPTG